MITRGTHVLTAALIALYLTACVAGFSAKHDSDPTHDFSGYQTFAWISDEPMIVGPTNRITNPLLQPRIMAAIEAGLQTRGYTKIADPEQADFVMSFTIGSRDEVRISSYPATYSGYGYGGNWRWGGAYYGMAPRTEVRQYEKGMLALDVFDVNERRPVWHSVATKSITESDRRRMDETVQAAVDAVLKGFPPE